MRKRALLAAALVCAGASHAAEMFPRVLTGRVLSATCHNSVCAWIRIDARRLLVRSPDGEAFELATTFWNTVQTSPAARPKGAGQKLRQVVLCSPTKPSLGRLSAGALMARTLFPDRPEKVGFDHASYIMYFAACHGVAVSDVAHEMPGLAARFAYRADASRPFEFETKSPGDPASYR